MSQAKKCDKCGKFFVLCNDDKSGGPSTSKQCWLRIVDNNKDKPIASRDQKWDLCPECVSAFEEFMGVEKEVSEPVEEQRDYCCAKCQYMAYMGCGDALAFDEIVAYRCMANHEDISDPFNKSCIEFKRKLEV